MIPFLLFFCLIPQDEQVLYFATEWCAPCQENKVALKILKDNGWDIAPYGTKCGNTVPIRTIDTDNRPDLVEKYKVDMIPCFIKLFNGKELGRIYGKKTAIEIAEFASKRQ